MFSHTYFLGCFPEILWKLFDQMAPFTFDPVTVLLEERIEGKFINV